MSDFDQNFDLELRLLLEGVYLKYQHDFRQYSVASLRRRIQSAMVKFDCQTVSQLQGRILHDPLRNVALHPYADSIAGTDRIVAVELAHGMASPEVLHALEHARCAACYPQA